MLAFSRTSHEKRQLMGDRPEQKGKDVSAMAAAQIIEEAKKTQEQDIEAVNRMKRMVDDSESVGVETNIKLKLQTEQLKNIHVEVDTVNVSCLSHYIPSRYPEHACTHMREGGSPHSATKQASTNPGICHGAYIHDMKEKKRVFEH
jgi:hypothetical protein